MKATYSICADVPRHLIRMDLTGFFEPSDIAGMVAERDDAHLLLRCGPNEHLTLVDMRGMEIQPQHSVDRFRSILIDPRTASRRIAFVVAKSLARMQIRRAASSRNAGYFTTVEEAEAWLFDGGATPG